MVSFFGTHKWKLARLTNFIQATVLKDRLYKGAAIACMEIFSFDENTETIDVHVTCIRQVATLLHYGEPQILKVFKNTLPIKLYCILFPMDDLRQAVETTRGILTKEKIDRQLSGQFSSTPFMSIKDNHSRRLIFDTGAGLGDKIDKLTVVIGNLSARDSGSGRQFKPQIYQGKRRGQNKGSYDRHSYDQ